jgi:HK97 gp10 family phage protein
MIGIETKFETPLDDNFDRFTKKMQDEILLSGVAVMAKVIYEEVKSNVHTNHFDTGTLFNAIYRAYSPEKSVDGKQVYNVSVNKRDAPHWHFLELGTSKQAAQPYLRPALDKMTAAVRAGELRMAEKMAGIK